MTPTPGKRGLLVAAAVVSSFIGLAVTIAFLSHWKVITFEAAMLMLVALVGLYFGFGVLIAVYRLIAKLE